MQQYRLIKPNINNKIYESHTVKSSAKKIYEELKKNNIMSGEFTIENINNHQFYTFNIKHKKIVQSAGAMPNTQPVQPMQSMQTIHNMPERKDTQNLPNLIPTEDKPIVSEKQKTKTDERFEKIEENLENITKKIEKIEKNKCIIM